MKRSYLLALVITIIFLVMVSGLVLAQVVGGRKVKLKTFCEETDGGNAPLVKGTTKITIPFCKFGTILSTYRDTSFSYISDKF